MIYKDQDKNEGLETSRFAPSDEPNTMDYHRNTLLYSDEGNIKASNTDHTKKFSLVNLDKISLVTPGEFFSVMPKLS